MVRFLSAFAALSLYCSPAPAAQLETVCEEVVTRYVPANNGAGPLWCYGSPLVVRTDDGVFVSTIETGEDVPPLCNTRWLLWQRQQGSWQVVNREQDHRQREPCPLVFLANSGLFLSANPSTAPPGRRYGPCKPTVFAFTNRSPALQPRAELPAWSGNPNFTDHSYRGLAADSQRGELLLLNIDASTSEQFVSLRDQAGVWQAKGRIRFPIRAAYPQVALHRGAAHVMAIGDIREPVQEWRELKHEKLKRDWDYVFRRLFYTLTANVSSEPFATPIEIDSVEQTAGHITNLDLHVGQDGVAHVLYLKRPHLHEFIRDAYFPRQPMTPRLEYAIIRNGRVTQRKTLASAPHEGAGIVPAYGRFHVAPGDALYAVISGHWRQGGKNDRWGNFIQRIGPPSQIMEIELAHAFRRFFTSSPRGGCPPSMTIDLFGIADDPANLRYAAVKLRN